MSEPWEVIYAAAARRALAKLPLRVAVAAATLIAERLAANPHRLGKELGPPLQGQRSARLGTHRIVYEIDEGAHAIHILAVRHRANVYGVR